MKILLTILFLSLLSSPSWSVSYDDLVKRDGLCYEKFSEVPFSGKVTGLTKGSIRNGKREGAWTHYYSNGQLSYKGNYKNGKMEGEWVSYFSDGYMIPSNTGTYKNGVKISD